MSFTTTNPYTGEVLARFDVWSPERIEQSLALAQRQATEWAARSIEGRAALMHRAAQVLRERKIELAKLITLEMGKIRLEAEAEVEKCALTCDFYAQHGPSFLADESVPTDAQRSFVAFQPLGPVLAIMPWNFPFWQVIRFAAPALVAGNVGLLKHASNVPQCALAIADVFRQAGFPDGAFQTMLIGGDQVGGVIADPRVKAVTLTGSDITGRKVAAEAGAHLKKTVMELGGSDAFIVLEDCDFDHTVEMAVKARFLNAGQSCIAAKRFVVVEAIAERFVAAFKDAVARLQPGDPWESGTSLGPMARGDLRDELDRQVQDSIARGAVAITGCRPLGGPGYFYAPSILDRVAPGMRAYDEEFFGPVALVLRARDEADAIRIANDSRFGLGGSVWTRDVARGERVAREMACGAAFVNDMVKSDPRMPFGGIKDSGYGRELSREGIREFVNVKTIWVAKTEAAAQLESRQAAHAE